MVKSVHIVMISSWSTVLDGIVIGGVVIVGVLDEAETGIDSSRLVVLDGMIDRGVSTNVASAERVMPIPAAMKSPTLLDMTSMFGEESWSIELMAGVSKAEDGGEAVCETDAAVELTQGPLVCCE